MSVVLAATHHDPAGRLNGQMGRLLPVLSTLYAHIAVVATSDTAPRTLADLRNAGASIDAAAAGREDAFRVLGRRRREAVALALAHAPDATHAHLCDFDRILHWAEVYPAELRDVVAALPQFDFTVLGRSARAFDSHPRVQRDTETLINHAFALAWGESWDVCAASRGVSRHAATVLDACDDPTIGNDCSWPLCLRRHNGIHLVYRAVEGLEFETPDRFPEEIAAAGGREAWIARVDANPRHWALRLELARIEVESVARFATPPGGSP